MSATEPLQRIPVGVVVERRKSTSAWANWIWRPLTVLPGEPATAPWTLLGADAEHATFYAGASEVALYRSESEQYADNLASGAKLWVVLRPTGVEPPYEIVRVTADPAEGEGFTASGEDIVEAVPMPARICETVAAFVAEHHVARPQFKRKRDRADPEALGRRVPEDRS